MAINGDTWDEGNKPVESPCLHVGVRASPQAAVLSLDDKKSTPENGLFQLLKTESLRPRGVSRNNNRGTDYEQDHLSIKT